MAKKNFKIRAKLVFDGFFTVKAQNRQEAEAKIQKNCGCLLGSDSVQSQDEDTDWDFDKHGSIIINRRKEDE